MLGSQAIHLAAKVTAYLPYSVDLTKLKSGNTLDVQVRSGPELLGTLLLGRGSVQWWPRGNKTHALWKKLAIIYRHFDSAYGEHFHAVASAACVGQVYKVYTTAGSRRRLV